MKLPQPMLRGTLVRRYKRFLADIELKTGELITAHCANPGAMMGVNMPPGLEVYVSHSPDPKRKLAYSLQLARLPSGLVGLNTSLPNRLVAEALETGTITELGGYDAWRREVKYGEKSRIDFVLSGPDRPDCYLEVKNAHLMRDDGLAEFPDSVTARGARHLGELATMVAAGYRAVNLFIVQRTDCTRFSVAGDLDPTYAHALERARAAGVETICYDCDVSTTEIAVRGPLPFA